MAIARKLLINVASSFFLMLHQSLAGLIIAIVAARILGVKGFGIISTLLIIESVYHLIVITSFTSSIGRYIAVFRGSQKDYSYIVGGGLLFISCSGFLFTLALYLLLNPIATLLKITEAIEALKLFILAMFTLVFSSFFSSILWGKNEIYKNAISGIVGSTVRVVLVVVFLLLGFNVLGYVLGVLIGRVAVLLLQLAYTYRDILNALKASSLWLTGLREIFPLTTSMLTSDAINYVSRWMDSYLVLSFLGVEGLGVYSVALRVVNVFNSFRGVIRSNIGPVYSLSLGRGGVEYTRKILLKASRFLAAIFTPLTLIAAGFSPIFFPIIFGVEFNLSGYISTLLLVVVGLTGVNAALGMLYPTLNLKKEMIWISCIVATFTILFELSLLGFGSLGIALGRGLALSLGFVVRYVILNRRFSFHLDYKSWFYCSILGVIGFLLVFLLGYVNILLAFTSFLLWIILYVYSVRALKLFTVDDVNTIRRALGSRFTAITSFLEDLLV